jgi:hypothetical protein
VTGAFRVNIQAVAKSDAQSAYCVVNELICAEIGRILYLPVPPGGLLGGAVHNGMSQGEIYASLDFNLTGNNLPPVDPSRCVSVLPDESTGLLVFDILIANSDRHLGNFSVDFESKPPAMSVFDHSHAFFGYEPGKGLQRLQTLRERLGVSGGSKTHGNRHCLLGTIRTSEYFPKWVKRVEEIPDFYIEEVCKEAGALGITAEEAAAARDFLIFRRDNIKDIILKHQDEFTGIKQWQLEL